MTQPDHTAEATEDLLHGMVAECADLIRTQLRPGMEACKSPDYKWGYARAISDLVRIAARAGEAAARLRGDGAETQHRIIVQRLPSERGQERGKG